MKEKGGSWMNKDRRSGYFLSSIEKVFDYALNFLAYYICYWITKLLRPVEFQVGHARIVVVTILLCILTSFLYHYYNVYVPMRTRRPVFFIGRIFLVNMEVLSLSVATVLLLRGEDVYPSVIWLTLCAFTSLLFMISKKIVMMSFLYNMRLKKRNVKHVLLVTDSQEMADAYMEEILSNPHFGYSVIGYVGNLNVIGLPHLGTTGDLDRLLLEYDEKYPQYNFAKHKGYGTAEHMEAIRKYGVSEVHRPSFLKKL